MANQKRCDPCLFDKETNTAIAFCVVCVEYLCQTCNRDHQRNKMTRMHRILTNEEIPGDATVFHKMKELLLCPKHPRDKVLYRCVDHDEFICITCCAGSHRKCEHIEDLTSCPVNRELSCELDGIEETAKSAKAMKTANLEQLRVERENVEKERTEFMESLANLVKKLDEDSRTKADKLVIPSMLELKNEISKCEEIETKVNSSKELLEVAKKYGNKAELTAISFVVERSIGKLDINSQKIKASKNDSFTIKFESSSVLNDAKEIGKITLDKVPKVDPKLCCSLHTSSDELREDCCTNMMKTSANNLSYISNTAVQRNKAEPMQWKVKNVSQHLIRGPEDREICFVSALLLLPTGLLLVADSCNRKLKVFRDYFNFAYEQILDDSPIDMCRVENLIGQYHAAVLETDTKCVKVFSVTATSMTRCKKWFTKLYCLSISKYRGSQIFILFSDKPWAHTGERQTIKIEVRDMGDGHIVQTFDVKRYFGDCDDMETLRIRYIFSNAIIVHEEDKIHCLEIDDEEPKERWFYKSNSRNNLEVVADIDADQYGYVYVCGKKSENVHQVFSSNFWKSRVIISNIKDPSAICVDTKNSRIILGRENDDNIHVFHMGK